MKLEIDGVDCTAWLDSSRPALVLRRLNRASEMTCALMESGFAIPEVGARVCLRRDSGEPVFTGYLDASPAREHLGWGQDGPVYRYAMHVAGDEWLLDREAMAQRPVMVMKSAGEIVREMTESLGLSFGLDEVADGDVVTQFAAPYGRWSECVGELASRSRMAYSVTDGQVKLRPVGERAFLLSEEDEKFSPNGLRLLSPDRDASDVTVVGKSETDAYVKDYFLGDGYSLRYNLTEIPFGRSTSMVFEQEYGAVLDAKWWKWSGTASVNSGRLWMQGTGSVEFAELVELKGALTFQHGSAEFQAASDGTIGALVSSSGMLAGFKVAKSVAQSTITAVINGVNIGSAITTVSGHRYLLSTRVFATETVREGERYRTPTNVLGAAERVADARVVLEVHEVDPNDPNSLVAASTVLYDGVVSGIPATCRYVLLDGADLHCSLAYTRVMRMPNVVVRSMLPGKDFRTRLTGAMMDGAECTIYNDALQFYSGSVPASGEKITAEYRGARKTVGGATSNSGAASIAVEMVSPMTRTSEDCVAAAQAVLEERSEQAWSGEYETWSDFLPELWPGDALQVRAASRGCEADVVVREVELQAVDLTNDRCWMSVKFANEAAESIALKTSEVAASVVASATRMDPERFVLANLPQAQVTAITSTTVTIDMGVEALVGGGFEIRRSNSGWDAAVDRNLVGRYQTRLVTVPRLTRVVTFCVRQYDVTGKYSRSATILHVDYPL